MIGEATLVPPISIHSGTTVFPSSSTGTESASAETSATARIEPQPTADQPGVCDCHAGAAKSLLQPPPPPPLSSGISEGSFQTSSLCHSPASFTLSFVPPTAITCGEEAG